MDSRRLTVMQVLPALNSGGVERGVLEVAEALVCAGHRSLVVSSGGRLVSELTRAGSTHFTLPVCARSPLSLRSVPRLRALMVSQQVDVVDLHSRLPAWLTWLAWNSIPAARRPRLISTLHGLHSVNAYSGIMCRGEWVIAVSETARAYVHRNFPHVPHSRIHVIPRGIEVTEFPRGYQPSSAWQQQFAAQFPQTRGQRLMMLPGRITRLKGHLDLLDLLQELRSRSVPVHALIVGGLHPRKTAYGNQLRRKAESLGLTPHVTWTGHRSDLKELYAISHLVLSLSQKPEAFGRTVAEALAMGTPVLGYAHGGVGEILSAQFPPGMVPPGDLRSLADRAEDLLTCPAAPDIRPIAFDRAAMLQSTVQAYQSIVSEHDHKSAA